MQSSKLSSVEGEISQRKMEFSPDAVKSQFVIETGGSFLVIIGCWLEAISAPITIPAGENHAMKVFFYGLFMDETLLAKKGVTPRNAIIGFVEGFALRIGERATLLRSRDGRAYGVVMDILASDADALYSESSVADYLPESVTVELMDGTIVEATCYNLPSNKVTGTNKVYAESLLNVASNLGLPEAYLDEIMQSGI